MVDMIKDGTGEGYLARVDNHHRIYTRAVTHSEAGQACEEEKYFMVSNTYGPPHARDDGWVLYLENADEERDMYIQELQISCAANGHWHMGFGGTISSGTTAVTPINLYVGSNIPAEVIAYKGSPIYFSDNPSRSAGGHFQAYNKYIEEFHGELIVPVSKSISMYVDTDDANERIAVGFQFYFK